MEALSELGFREHIQKRKKRKGENGKIFIQVLPFLQFASRTNS